MKSRVERCSRRSKLKNKKLNRNSSCEIIPALPAVVYCNPTKNIENPVASMMAAMTASRSPRPNLSENNNSLYAVSPRKKTSIMPVMAATAGIGGRTPTVSMPMMGARLHKMEWRNAYLFPFSRSEVIERLYAAMQGCLDRWWSWNNGSPHEANHDDTRVRKEHRRNVWHGEHIVFIECKQREEV